MDRKVDEILTALNDLIDDSKELPLTNKAMVEKEQVLYMIDEIRSQMPHEIRQAKAIVADRTKILDDARTEAEGIVRTAEERRRALLDDHEITRSAREEGERIVGEAKAQSREIRAAASTYVSDLLRDTENALEDNLAKVKSTLEENLATFKSTREKLSAVQNKMTEAE